MDNERGNVHIFTGDGKGKTTSSVGILCRARSYGLKCCYISFHKNRDVWPLGELKILKKIGVDVFCFACKHPGFDKKITFKAVAKECLEGLEFVKQIYKDNKYDVLVLDEINISVRDGFIEEAKLIELIDYKPKKLDLIITGRGVSSDVIKRADLVSVIKNIKHPFDKGRFARRGIDF